MIKIHFNKNLLDPCSELVILAPLAKEKFKYEKRFTNAIESGDQYVEYSSIEDCDYVVLPYKWNKNNKNTQTIIKEAHFHHKKVLIFHIDDSDEDINVENSYVFRTSFYRSTQKPYEFAFPCFKEDNFKNSILNNPKLNIGFCGQIVTKLRKETITQLKNSRLETNFIIRNTAWPSIEWGKTKEEVIKEFYKNMDKNLFNLCIRGGGNFSYRLYETMMMGRIPIIIDTDIVFPFNNLIKWQDCGVIGKNNDNLISLIEKFYRKKDMVSIQKNNRKIWEKFLSPIGVIQNIKKTLENNG